MTTNTLRNRLRQVFIAALLASVLPACGNDSQSSMPVDSNEPELGRYVAPEQLAPADDASLSDTKPSFSWRFEPCKDQATVELCSDSQCANVQQSFTSASCTGMQLENDLAPGSYFWRVARSTNNRMVSSWSPIRHFLIAPASPAINSDLYGVYSVGKNDVWSVGAAGTILHFTGSWQVETSPSTEDLRAVWATSGGQVWAVGTAGTILHRNGTSWTAAQSPTSEDLLGVWGSAANDVWAVGTTGIILHFDGASWSIAHNRMTGTFKGIWGSAANNVWVVGSGRDTNNDYAALLLHWDGTSWSESYVCNPAGTHSSSGGWLASLTDVWGVAGGTLWAAGQCQSGASMIPYGYVAQNSGSGWGDTAGFGFGEPLGKYRPLRAIWSSSDSDVWAASPNETVNGAGSTPNMLHWDGSSWTASSQNITVGINDLGGTAANDVWAVGLNGKRLHFDGSNWTAAP